jgi:antitoxin ParD1/3/4
MNMINISLPDALKQFVDTQLSGGTYKSASEYVVRLIKADQDQKEHEEIEQKILVAINRGQFSPMTAEDWDQL